MHGLRRSLRSCPRQVNAGNKNTPSTHHPRRRNVDYLNGWIKKKRSHMQKSHPKSGEPQRYSWGTHTHTHTKSMLNCLLVWSNGEMVCLNCNKTCSKLSVYDRPQTICGRQPVFWSGLSDCDQNLCIDKREKNTNNKDVKVHKNITLLQK